MHRASFDGRTIFLLLLNFNHTPFENSLFICRRCHLFLFNSFRAPANETMTNFCTYKYLLYHIIFAARGDVNGKASSMKLLNYYFNHSSALHFALIASNSPKSNESSTHYVWFGSFAHAFTTNHCKNINRTFDCTFLPISNNTTVNRCDFGLCNVHPAVAEPPCPKRARR